MKLLQSIALLAGATAVMVVAGLSAFLVVWVALLGVYSYSRLSEKALFLADWSWFQFLVAMGLSLAIPYVLLLVTAGF